MTGADHNPTNSSRTLGNIEQTWCRAVAGGTGTTVLALQMAKPPSKLPLLHEVLKKLRHSHPLLRCKLHYNATTKEFSFLSTAAVAPVAVEFHDIPSTKELLLRLSTKETADLSPCHLILEHNVNDKIWSNPSAFPCSGADVILGRLYALSETRCMVVLRLHAAACDRTTAESVLRELMELVMEAEGGRKVGGAEKEGEGSLGIERMVPRGMGKKTMWAHGVDMLGYSLSSLRLTNLKFKNTTKSEGERYSQVVRLKIDTQQTTAILAGCKSRGIKLCGALAAAGLIAAHSTQLDSDKLKKKYGVVTLIDTRSLLEPPLSTHHFGYYQLPILNTHTINGRQKLWDLAEKSYGEFERYKKSNRHFSDMDDLNFLMKKAMENPSLTASSSLRTSLISVFEDPVIDNTKEMKQEIGVEDYMGCSSAHGVGPSLAIFDTIRNGELDCACVYPAPLHSRDQIIQLVHLIKKILVDGIQ
ncbi:hypothetical protein C2S53_010473 [Perilla frutescens var. hirtella]|uniref:Uncharacterized protein n=1 Tax=Perilla frutescens var. hirtella TaxID=608512 RepID=A0AAD4JB47_PERFH|nr:hypothetical protein C2S53_010473 [Perilla frutescens var. hirtella]